MDAGNKEDLLDDKCTTKLESIENGNQRMAFDFNLLPDNVYVKLTNYMSVNDIDHLGGSGLDARTELAFVNLRHATIYAENPQEAENCWFPKLPNTIKTIVVWLREGYVGCLTETIGKKFPNLEKLPLTHASTCFIYLESLNSPSSNLTSIGCAEITSQEKAEKIRRAISLCPGLKEMALCFYRLNEQFVDMFPKCTSLEKLTLTNYDFRAGAYSNANLKRLISLLPSLKLLSLKYWPFNEEFAQRFLTFCTKQKFKTELNTDYEQALQLQEQFRPLVTEMRMDSVNVMSLKSRLKDFTNLREISIKQGPSELFLALCDKDITQKPFIIPFVCAQISTEGDMDSFKMFLEVRSTQLTTVMLAVNTHIVSRVMRMLGSLANFRLDELSIHIIDGGDQLNPIPVADVKALYNVSVHRIVTLYTPWNLSTLISEADSSMSDRKCRIYHK